jgi:hypothetical protein
VTLRATGDRRTSSESIDDLAQWLATLSGGPAVNRTALAECPRPQHADDPATWFYVEADAGEGVARLRCLACGHAHSVLDSAERWSFPSAWSCRNCAQSIAEVAYGLHVEGGNAVTWVAVGVRCVNCGEINGVTDMVVPGQDVDEVLAAL